MNLFDLLFPNRCLHCNIIIDHNEIICESCFSHVHFSHFGYNENNILKQKCNMLFPIENAFALMVFEKESLSREIIHQLKYKKRKKVGRILADWTIENLTFRSNKPDLIVTVPLHPKKEKERGYNQLHLYANTLSKHYNIPCNHQYLQRNFYAKAQALKNKQNRAQTQNLFSVTQTYNETHFLLIDDVYTTGNTISTLAWEILHSGKNNKVSILVMAMD